MMRITFLIILVTLKLNVGYSNSIGGEGINPKSPNKNVSEVISYAPHGMVNIYALPDNKLVIKLDSYSKKDRVVEFFNEDGVQIGEVTIWAYNKERTFLSTLTQGKYTYHVSDEDGVWKGQLVIIN